MNLYSLLKSSSLEILLSKRITSFVYAILGLSIMAHTVSASLQFWNAYHNLGEFDVTVSQFFIIGLTLLLPFWITGGLILRAVLQRARVALWARRVFRIAMYKTSLLPAEAGLLVDYEYNKKELYATLLDLHFKGYIEITPEVNHLQLTLLDKDTRSLSRYEVTLLGVISANHTKRVFSSFGDHTLATAGQDAHEYLIYQLQSKGLILKEKLPGKVIRSLFRTIYVVAGFVGLLSLHALVFDYNEVSTIVYPRSAVSPSQLWLLGLLITIVVGVIISGFWPRLPAGDNKENTVNWIEAMGFMWYLEKVFKHRFSSSVVLTQDKNTLRQLFPYALALGVVPVSNRIITNVLNYTNTSESNNILK